MYRSKRMGTGTRERYFRFHISFPCLFDGMNADRLGKYLSFAPALRSAQVLPEGLLNIPSAAGKEFRIVISVICIFVGIPALTEGSAKRGLNGATAFFW